MARQRPHPPINQEIGTLREIVPQLVLQLRLDGDVDITTWQAIIDKKLLPKLAPDFPLVASICGGGSSGKSSLFNAIIQDNISPTGGTAGINRRILISGNVDSFSDGSHFADLFNSFGFRPEPLMDKNDLIQQGNACYVLNTQTPSNLILLDTPDFDTGLKGTYLNREVARQALEVSDVLIYIFTNANYNNRDNTDFISEILTGIGTRKCFLVYRVYASYPDEEILAHAGTVAENLYGRDAAEQVLGIYRADEDNRVAADEKFMDMLPVGEWRHLLDGCIGKAGQAKDSTRFDVFHPSGRAGTGRRDFRQGRGFAARAGTLPKCPADLAKSLCAPGLEAFSHGYRTQTVRGNMAPDRPLSYRWMRKAGNIIDFPIRAAVKTVKWIRGRESRPPRSEENSQVRYSEETMDDLLTAANDLWRKFIDSEISVSLVKTDPVAEEMRKAYQEIETQHKRLTKGNPHQMQVFSQWGLDFHRQGPSGNSFGRDIFQIRGNGVRPSRRSCPVRKNSWIRPARSTGILKHWWKRFRKPHEFHGQRSGRHFLHF